MSQIKVKIIDLKCNNIFSLNEACKKAGYKTSVVDSYKNNNQKFTESDILFLPGVGSFKQAMKTIINNGFDELIYNHILKQKLLVGICLGMQLLCNSSTEIEFTNGLKIIDGKVLMLKKSNVLNFPNIGWRKIHTSQSNFWEKFDSKYFYFIHSFYCLPQNKNLITSYFNYGKNKICSSFHLKNIIGTQFHPEKSGREGINFLRNLKKLI